ncbi:hypothetical protein Gotur_001806 [Gossypium turneri]
MKRCISGQKVEVFFPHLVTTLCKKARVPMEDNEKFMKPTKNREDRFDDPLDARISTRHPRLIEKRSKEKEEEEDKAIERDFQREEDDYKEPHMKEARHFRANNEQSSTMMVTKLTINTTKASAAIEQ